MSVTDYTKLNKFVTQIGETLLMSQLETNLKSYFDWGLLGIGAFTSVSIPTSGTYGGAFDSLRPVEDPAYTDGQVWEAPRKDWVWETGVSYNIQPIDISGVYINGSLYGTGDATYSHHYNYPLGRVIFDTPVATTNTVQLEYSYRNVQVYVADQAGWWDEIQYDSLRVDDPTYNNAGSGNWGILANHRVQLPAIIIEAVPQRSFRPYQIGEISNYVYQDVIFHVIAESRWWRNQLLDIISLEKDKTIWMFDNNTLLDSGVYPLDYRGMRVSNPTMYPTFVDKYRFKMARFYNVSVTEMLVPTSRLFTGKVKATMEVVMA